MKNGALTFALAVLCAIGGLSLTPVQAADVYNCTFEQGSQGSAFTLGYLDGQGTPAWTYGYYTGGTYESGTTVSNARAYAGTQSAFVADYTTAQLTLARAIRQSGSSGRSVLTLPPVETISLHPS